MTTSNETRTLSSDELDAVSGGVKMDGCTKNGSFSLFGTKFTLYTCDDGGYAVSAQGKA